MKKLRIKFEVASLNGVESTREEKNEQWKVRFLMYFVTNISKIITNAHF